jgi:hypothetical protein
MRQWLRSHLTYANVMATLAVFGVLAGGSAYAASKIGANDIARNAIHARHIAKNAVKTAKIKNGAVTSAKVEDFGLGLHDLGGEITHGTATVSEKITVPPFQCRSEALHTFIPPKGVGSLVVGFLTAGNGKAVLDNSGAVVPSVMSETSQGGAIPHLFVCDGLGAGQTVPAGSVFHWRLIGP